MARALPTIHINGTTYVIDERLHELRNDVDPQDAMRFPSRELLQAFIEKLQKPQLPRPPTPDELHDLVHLWREDDSEEAVYDAYIAVFDGYMTDCPGYQGRVMTVVWSGAPEFYDVYVWHDGQIKLVDRDR